MKKRVNFFKKNKTKDDNIFFTVETKIDMSPNENESIWLTNGSKIKLKKGNLEVYDLLNWQKKIWKIINNSMRLISILFN